MAWHDAVTDYVREQIRLTKWEERSYISTLVTIEKYALQGGPKHFAEALGWRELQTWYPVACRMISDAVRLLKANPTLLHERLAERTAGTSPSRAVRYRVKAVPSLAERGLRELWRSKGGLD